MRTIGWNQGTVGIYISIFLIAINRDRDRDNATIDFLKLSSNLSCFILHLLSPVLCLYLLNNVSMKA